MKNATFRQLRVFNECFIAYFDLIRNLPNYKYRNSQKRSTMLVINWIS